MEDVKNRLSMAYKKLFALKGQCSNKRHHACQLGKLSYTQIEYLKIIDYYGAVTVSQLAKRIHNSKPTVTEMVKKFIAYGIIKKEKCESDGRKAYLTLTDKGKDMARLEQNTIDDLVNIMLERLNDEEVNIFIDLLEKIAGEGDHSIQAEYMEGESL